MEERVKKGRPPKFDEAMTHVNYRENAETLKMLRALAKYLGTDVSTEIRKATAHRCLLCRRKEK